MSRLFNTLSIPFLAGISIPLISFAAFTTSIALFTLLVRASVVYVELFLALVQSAITPAVPASTSTTPSRPRSPDASPSKSRRRPSSNSSTSTLTISTSALDSHVRKDLSFTSLLNTGTSTRDYEGVGGWHIPTTDQGEEDEEALWIGMNSRLELPAMSMPGTPSSARKHKRSLTGGSQRDSGTGSSPEWTRKRYSGTASPEGYFGHVSGVSVAFVESPNGVRSADGGIKSSGASRAASRRGSASLAMKPIVT